MSQPRCSAVLLSLRPDHYMHEDHFRACVMRLCPCLQVLLNQVALGPVVRL